MQINANGDGTFSPTIPNAALTPIPGVTNFDPALLPYARVAFAKVRQNQGRAKVMFIGDSTMVGAFAGTGGTSGYTAAKPKAIPAVVASILNGQGLPSNASALIGTNTAGVAGYDPTLTAGSGWAMGGVGSVVGGSTWSNSTTTASNLSLYPPVNVSQCDVYYVDNTAHFTVDFDGTNPTTVVGGNTNTIKKATITATDGTHVANIARISGTVLILGIDCYSTTNYTISVWNAAWSGSTSANWVVATQPYSVLTGIAVYAPDLTIIDLGINDEAGAIPYGTFYANMQQIITAAKTLGDVILVFHHDCSGHATSQQVTLKALQALSVANNVPLVNFMQRLGVYAQANALGEMANTEHLTAIGYADEAAMIADVLRRV